MDLSLMEVSNCSGFEVTVDLTVWDFGNSVRKSVWENSYLRFQKYLLHKERNKDLENMYRPEAKKSDSVGEFKDDIYSLHLVENVYLEEAKKSDFVDEYFELLHENFQECVQLTPRWHIPSIKHENFEHQTAYGDTELASMNSGIPIKKIKRPNSDDLNNFSSSMKCSKDPVLLLLLAMMMMGTLVAASRYAAVHNQPQERQDFNGLLFTLCNSTAFVTSLAGVIHLLHEFPFKPWPQITVSMLFGPYMLLVFKISPNEALPLLVLFIPILILAAAGKLFGFARERSFSGSSDTYSA